MHSKTQLGLIPFPGTFLPGLPPRETPRVPGNVITEQRGSTDTEEPSLYFVQTKRAGIPMPEGHASCRALLGLLSAAVLAGWGPRAPGEARPESVSRPLPGQVWSREVFEGSVSQEAGNKRRSGTVSGIQEVCLGDGGPAIPCPQATFLQRRHPGDGGVQAAEGKCAGRKPGRSPQRAGMSQRGTTRPSPPPSGTAPSARGPWRSQGTPGATSCGRYD